MISVSVKFTPRNSLGQFISGVVSPAVAASVQASATLIQQTAQAMCPVETGALRDSITISDPSEGSSSISQSVGPTMYYADYVEYGTGRRGGPAPYAHVQSWPGQVAQPYMRPALDEARGSILDLFRAQISSAIGAA